MLTFATVALSLLALLVVVRFVQPELIYSVRRGLVMVSTNRAFLYKLAKRPGADVRFRQLLVHEARYETRTNDEIFILQDRIFKISELYRLLDPRRQVVRHRDQAPQVCIVELGALLSNMGRSIQPNPEHDSPIVKAGALLQYIGNGVRASQGEMPFQNDEEVDSWFIDNPINIEQVIELLIASVIALAHRQQAALSQRTQPDVSDFVDVWTEVNKVEKRLRLLVRLHLKERYKTEEAIFERVKHSLGDRDYAECIQRMENVRKKTPDVALDFFGFIYWGQLETLIFAEWETFKRLFQEKSWLKSRVERIVYVRNALAHNRYVSEDDKRVAIGYCSEIRERLRKYEHESALPRIAHA